jgi:hypothetical protein
MARPYRIEWALSSDWMARGTMATSDRRRKTGLFKISAARSPSTRAISFRETDATSSRKSVTTVSGWFGGDVEGPGAADEPDDGALAVPHTGQKRVPSASWRPHAVQNMARGL